MLECVVNISEGRDAAWLEELRDSTPGCVDIHSDAAHHRSVLTILGGPDPLIEAVVGLARRVIASLDLIDHAGVHPRLGVLDVVPFVPLGDAGMDDAVAARDATARRLADELDLPCFLYGPLDSGKSRSLPELRRRAFADLTPDLGPDRPHPVAGAACLGAREILVAWNLWLRDVSLERARNIARSIRSSELRALGLEVDDAVQVSCNLLAPSELTPAMVADQVAEIMGGEGRIIRSELVGLAPRSCLAAVPKSRWGELDLSEEQTIEVAAQRAGLGAF